MTQITTPAPQPRARSIITPEAFQISERNIIPQRTRGRHVTYVSEATRRKLEKCERKKKADRTFLDTDTDDTTDSEILEDITDDNSQDNQDDNDVGEAESNAQENIPLNSPVEFLMSLPPEERKEADENEEPETHNNTDETGRKWC